MIQIGYATNAFTRYAERLMARRTTSVCFGAGPPRWRAPIGMVVSGQMPINRPVRLFQVLMGVVTKAQD